VHLNPRSFTTCDEQQFRGSLSIYFFIGSTQKEEVFVLRIAHGARDLERLL
jgi:hypothetical protein